MIKVKEKELFEVVKKFNSNNIVLQFNDLLKANVKIRNSKITYNRKNGILKIKDEENSFEIDITSSYSILRDNNYTRLEIYLDNNLDIAIIKNKGIQ